MFFTASIITVVAGYRFVKLMAPCFAQRCHSVGTISCSLVVIWMGSTMLSTPSLVIRDTTIHEDNEIVCKDNYALIALVPKVHETILLSRFFCGLAIPFLVTACCSGIILCRSGSSKMKSLQGYIIIRWVIIAYFLCWVPYQVVFILTYKTRKENKTLTTTWMPIVTVLSMANNVLTPAICIFMGDKKQKWMETAFNEKEEVGSQKVSEDQEL
ncbi:CML1 protein, partial [Polypterus senegalus]